MTMKKYHPFEILAALDCKSLQKPNEHGWVEITALVRRKKKGRGPGRSDKDHMGRSGGMRFRNTKGGDDYDEKRLKLPDGAKIIINASMVNLEKSNRINLSIVRLIL